MTPVHRHYKLRSKGFTLLEQALVVTLVAVLAGMVVVTARGRIDNAKGQRAVEEMAVLAEKCVEYYQKNNSWPVDVTVLKPDYLPAAFGNNPFGRAYRIASTGQGGVTVATYLPKGSKVLNAGQGLTIRNIDAAWDEAQLFRTNNVRGTESAAYEKKYLYGQ